MKDLISMIYITENGELDKLLRLRIKFYMINRMINNNIEK